jgi:hypothetical protein
VCMGGQIILRRVAEYIRCLCSAQFLLKVINEPFCGFSMLESLSTVYVAAESKGKLNCTRRVSYHG